MGHGFGLSELNGDKNASTDRLRCTPARQLWSAVRIGRNDVQATGHHTGSALDQQRSGAPATTSQLDGNEREHRGLLAHLSSGVDEQRLALRYLIELQAARAMQRCIKGRRMTQSKQEHRIHLPWLSAKDKLESRCCKSSRTLYGDTA